MNDTNRYLQYKEISRYLQNEPIVYVVLFFPTETVAYC